MKRKKTCENSLCIETLITVKKKKRRKIFSSFQRHYQNGHTSCKSHFGEVPSYEVNSE